MEIDESEFYNQLLDYHNILYLCHRNADPDALGSAFALKEAIGGTIGIIGGCDRVASQIAKQLDIKFVTDPVDNYDLVVVIDTSTLTQLDGFPLKKYAVIDHHTTTSLNENAVFFLHRNKRSTAEIVLEVLNTMGAPIMRRVAFALIAGIITDTGNFKHASADSFKAVAELIELSGIEYSEVMDAISSVPQDVSMRIAFLKAAQRALIERVGEWIVVTSQVSSFSGSAASNLISIGADVAFVASKDDGMVKVSARARKCAINAGVNLARLMEEISVKFNGTGGGHEGAAGMDVYGEAEVILACCTEYTRKSLLNKHSQVLN
ncbi:exopolyphosphatase-like enzyme [Candidatus Methanoperedens nitroreducens]|uniref:Exopolyphosphatase-like enzyme n=1 Tax=Candidatus Methanoperedens nitratireducens TaxID=1392998 RepID=A0A062V3P8_9EURY|nr:DHH family phosphoesterase [Candidatus Methanoperedens nitroreducens]KCZ70419.1 exopolyphosphatase-like enzyme [Candidatus Methanoperedens nitroreducens]MDJ1420857.1 DHH family phosphoesterase [Candidatus Methanoperedens sp.]